MSIYVKSGQFPSTSRNVRSDNVRIVPGSLAVMRVIGGRAGSEYWTLRCVRLRRRVHLDIVHPHTRDGVPAA